MNASKVVLRTTRNIVHIYLILDTRGQVSIINKDKLESNFSDVSIQGILFAGWVDISLKIERDMKMSKANVPLLVPTKNLIIPFFVYLRLLFI